MPDATALFAPVPSLSPAEAKAFMAEHPEGSFTLLDVRQPGEYTQGHIPGAELIPLPNLPNSHGQLERENPILVYCASGRRSMVASHLLLGLGFRQVYNLLGGIKAWQGMVASGPRELNLDLVTGDESPAEMIALVYGMEMALGIFYRQMAQAAQDEALQELLSKLADWEDQHKRILFQLREAITPSAASAEAYEADIQPRIVEGGYHLQDLLEKNRPFLESPEDVLQLAMMFETQALDLYLRFAQVSAHPQAREVLLKLSDAEKAHLEALGHLLDEKLP